jgi:pyruvate dehydrogenase E1 component alpha subunit
LEFVTYRLAPHSAAGDASYVPKEELREALEREPVQNYRQWLVARQVLTDLQVEQIQARASFLVEDAFEFATASSAPAADELLSDVYAAGTIGPVIW